MARPIWKGYISFGLVNIPVILYSAEKKFDIQFKLIDSRNNGRVRYSRINEKNGKEVPWEDIAKGYEYDEDKYVLMTDKDFKAIAGENTKTINIETFVAKDSLDEMDFDKPYYLVPDKKGDKGYVILREILKDTKKVGIAKVIIHTREYLSALVPYQDALVLNLMRYHNEIRKPDEFDLPKGNMKEYKISSKEIDAAKQLVASMSSKWKPNEFKDDYRQALEKWIEEQIHKHTGHTKMKRRSASTLKADSNVVDFVSLLKKSLQPKKKIAAKSKSSSSKHKIVKSKSRKAK